MKLFVKVILLCAVVAALMLPSVGVPVISQMSIADAATLPSGDILSPSDVGNDGVNNINAKIYTLAKVFAGLVLGIAVLVIVYAGIKYVLAAGNDRETASAKMMIISAIIGIVISLGAFAILNAVTSVF